jgi:hypothetical protein
MSRVQFSAPRVMALAGALCAVVYTSTGFTNRSLHARAATLLGVLTCTNTYVMTSTGNELRSPTPRSTTDSCSPSSTPSRPRVARVCCGHL